MKKYIIIIVLFVVSLFVANAQGIKQQLEKLSKEYNFTFEELDKGNVFNERYLLWFEQELNQVKPDGKTFKQRVFLSHIAMDKPVVFVTEGYWADYAERPNYTDELTDILHANQIVVEHRFFPPSVPDSSCFDWKYLTIENAAIDHHRIVEILKHIYKKKWLATGISKGGQATIYHKYFYPNDVSMSVPVVAPLNFSTEEERVYNFLKTVGSSSCRKKIEDFQMEMIKNKEKYLPYFKDYAFKKNQTYEKVGGIIKGYELTVLEFSFAFWQWGHSCKSILLNAEPKEMVRQLISVSSIDWVSDQGIEMNQPFFYQAMHEFGMYGYDIIPFKNYVSFNKNPTFAFTFPKGIKVEYNNEIHKKVDCFIRHKAKNMIFIVGGNDPWGSTSVDITYSSNLIKVVKPGGCHKTRILNLPTNQKELVINRIKEIMK